MPVQRKLRERDGWLLWCDWCSAIDADPTQCTPEALKRFQTDVRLSDRALNEVMTTARELGLLEQQSMPTDPWSDVEKRFGFESLDHCLMACPSSGWTVGYRGRRDAWLLMLPRGLRLTRAEALSVSPAELTPEQGADLWTLRGQRLVRHDDSRACLRCVATRWLACIETEHSWGRTSVRMLVSKAGIEGQEFAEHVCDDRSLGLRTNLPIWATLAPALDQHGWISSGYRKASWHNAEVAEVSLAPMTPRALTGIISARSRNVVLPLDRGVDAARPALKLISHDPVDEESLFEQLDAACARADEANAKMAALLDENVTWLRR